MFDPVAALIAWDDSRPRSKQLGPGFSSLGGCARRVHHEIRRDPRCNTGVKRLPAIYGTIIHEHLAREYQGPGHAERKLILEEIGLPGTADLIEPGVLTDYKTTTLRSLDYVRRHGPSRGQRWQVHSYAHAWNSHLADTAEEDLKDAFVDTVRLIFMPRDGDEDDVVEWEEPYEPEIARQAMDWFDEISRATADGMVPLPEKDPTYCARWCPYFGAMCPGRADDQPLPRIDDPWIADAAAEYADAVTARSALDDRKASAREALAGFTGIADGYRVTWAKSGYPIVTKVVTN